MSDWREVRARLVKLGENNTVYLEAADAKRMEGRRRNLVDAVAKWQTPRATDGSNGGPGQSRHGKPDGLVAQVFATPTAHPRTHSPRKVDHGAQLANQAGGALNPTWVEWLMGFPLGWTACADWAMRKSRPKRRSRGSCSADPENKR